MRGQPLAMFAITGAKGGCGKTTTTLVLARALVRLGYDPLVVDADCDMPDIHHRIGLSGSGGVDDIAGGRRIRRVAVESNRLPGVSVVTGGKRANLLPALRRLGRWHGPVLVDCAAGVSTESLAPLRCARQSLVVSTDQPQCIEDTERTLDIAHRLSAPPLGVVLRETLPVEQSIPEHWSLLGSVPPVEEPLTSPAVNDEFVRISRSIAEQSGCKLSGVPG